MCVYIYVCVCICVCVCVCVYIRFKVSLEKYSVVTCKKVKYGGQYPTQNINKDILRQKSIKEVTYKY